MATALMSVPSANVTLAASPFGYTRPAPPSSAAWKKLPPTAVEICVVISPGAPCCISTVSIWAFVNCTLSVFHAPSFGPITAVGPV
jgi:hypothetical protein